MTQRERTQRINEFEETLTYWQEMGLGDFVFDAKEKGYKLSLAYSNENVEELYRYILEQKVNHRDKSEAKTHEFMACYYYIGEWFISNYGGIWKLSLDNVDSVYYTQPVVIEFINYKEGIEFSPRDKVIGVILNRVKTSLKENLDYFVGVIPYKSAIEDVQLEE